MKKNKMMRLASVLLVAVLMTTSVISGTFAKYVTTDTGSDTARVAKWGVVIQVDGALYGTDYYYNEQTDKGDLPTIYADNKLLYVVSSHNPKDNVVAPGTKNDEGFAFSINGVPEVQTQLTVDVVCQNIYLAAGEYAVMVKAPTVTETSLKTGTYYTYDTTNKKYIEVAANAVFDSTATYYTMQDYVNLTKTYYPVVYTSADGANINITKTIDEDSLNYIVDSYLERMTAFGAEPDSATPAYETPDPSTEIEVTLSGGKPVNNVFLSNGMYTYNFTHGYTPNFDYSKLSMEGETLTWEWKFDNNANLVDDVNTTNVNEAIMYDGADTILANLMAQKSGDSTFKGEVVKITTENNVKTIKAPTPAGEATITNDVVTANGALNDYHLNTSFSITITVEQVD